MKPQTKKIIGTFGLSAFLIVLMVLIPMMMGFGRGGFASDETLTQFMLYVGFGGFFLLGILCLFIVGIMIKQNDAVYGNDSIAFNDMGEKPAIPIFKNFTIVRMFWLSTILFLFVGLINHITVSRSYTGMKMLEQQFTVLDSVIFSSALIPVAENLGSAFLIALCLFSLRHYSRKQGVSSINFVGFSYFIIFIVGLYGVANHLLRYSGSDIALIYVFIFWTLGALITLLTGSFIPFLVMHISNNLFIDLGRHFSSETILIYFGFFIVLLTIFYILYYHTKFGGDRK